MTHRAGRPDSALPHQLEGFDDVADGGASVALLTPSEIRAVHAQVYTYALSEYAKDDYLDESERARLQMLHECLMQLGWAPGT